MCAFKIKRQRQCSPAFQPYKRSKQAVFSVTPSFQSCRRNWGVHIKICQSFRLATVLSGKSRLCYLQPFVKCNLCDLSTDEIYWAFYVTSWEIKVISCLFVTSISWFYFQASIIHKDLGLKNFFYNQILFIKSGCLLNPIPLWRWT